MMIKSHMIIIDIEKAFNKTQHSFMIKSQQNMNRRKWLGEEDP